MGPKKPWYRISLCAGAAVDLSTLSVVDGKTCWVLYADVLVLNADGNILDAAAIGIKVGRNRIIALTLSELRTWVDF